MAVKHERLEARISSDQKHLLQQAASLSGRSLSDFVVQSAQAAAEETIRAHQLLLTARDSAAFVDALLSPPAPNDQLRAVAKRYEALVQP